jgi:hypothetical protein
MSSIVGMEEHSNDVLQELEKRCKEVSQSTREQEVLLGFWGAPLLTPHED